MIHSVAKGDIIGGAEVPFYAVDSVVTNDGQLVVVGFEWTPSMMEGVLPMNFSLSGVLPYLERKAVFQVYNNTVKDLGSCIGCDIDYYNNVTLGKDGICSAKCNCENGYCNDDLKGDGECYCTIMSYGETCKACDGIGSCDPLKGLCNSGPDGDGKCKFCYDIDIESLDPFNVSFGLGDNYGPKCDYPCTCHPDWGICYTTGNIEETRAGECIYCTNSNAYGPNCDMLCDCDSKKGYCDNGVSGTGCVDYDYGGLLKNKGWQFYTVIGSTLFVFFFTITFWQTNKHYKEQHNGESLPWCPKKEKNNDDEDKDMFNGNNKNGKAHNDLNERMLNANGNGYTHLIDDEDSNEPPAVSHPMINDGNGVIEQEQNDHSDRYQI